MNSKLLLLLACALLTSQITLAAENTAKHRIVLEVVTSNPDAWKAILNNVENLQKAFGPDKTKVEVVVHGKGIALVSRSDQGEAARMKRLAESGVVFAACQNTMRAMKLTKADLLPFVTVVDSGVAEIVRRQEAGWAYIKGGL